MYEYSSPAARYAAYNSQPYSAPNPISMANMQGPGGNYGYPQPQQPVTGGQLPPLPDGPLTPINSPPAPNQPPPGQPFIPPGGNANPGQPGANRGFNEQNFQNNFQKAFDQGMFTQGPPKIAVQNTSTSPLPAT